MDGLKLFKFEQRLIMCLIRVLAWTELQILSKASTGPPITAVSPLLKGFKTDSNTVNPQGRTCTGFGMILKYFIPSKRSTSPPKTFGTLSRFNCSLSGFSSLIWLKSGFRR